MQWGKILNFFTVEELNRLKSFPKDCEFAKAMAIVGRVYAERLDLSGNAEACHFINVSNRASTVEGKIVGLLHDVVEDGHLDFGDLLLLGFSPYIVNTLQILCHDKKKYPKYEDYITSIIESGNLLALEIKLYDISDNLSPRRIMSLPKERQEKAYKKWCAALPRIATAYEELSKEQNRERIRIA